MGFTVADAIAASRPNPKGPACGVAKVLAELPADEAAQLVDIIDNREPEFSHVRVAEMMRHLHRHDAVRSSPPSDQTIGRHRRRICQCGRDGQ